MQPSLLFENMGCSQLKVLPKLSLLVLVLELCQGEGRLCSSPDQLGKVLSIAGALLVPQGLPDTGAVAPLEWEQTCPEMLR